MIPVSCGCAGVSKSDDATWNLETQLHVPQDFGIWENHIFEGRWSAAPSHGSPGAT